jgi:hypothetical protein
MNRLTYIFGLLILISSCKSKLEDESIFPKVKNVTDLEKTDFVPTLESSFNTQINVIYGATLPFAWNEIKAQIGTPLKDFTSIELEELNGTKSFINVLKEDEYETSVKVNGNEIRAMAYFRKSLPFEESLTKFEESLKFGKSEVESFGFWGNCSFARINYFNNENDFSISLFPEDKAHEIILIMNQESENGLSDFTEYLQVLYQEENENVYFNDIDKVEIPIIEFNLEKIFGQIIGSKFSSEMTEYKVTEAYQRNAFVLNENGAEVESEAVFAVEETAVEMTRPKPKMMIFNKPFVLLLKRKDAKNPYFGVHIGNDVLLKRKE